MEDELRRVVTYTLGEGVHIFPLAALQANGSAVGRGAAQGCAGSYATV
jgi:hypothetical protein